MRDAVDPQRPERPGAVADEQTLAKVAIALHVVLELLERREVVVKAGLGLLEFVTSEEVHHDEAVAVDLSQCVVGYGGHPSPRTRGVKVTIPPVRSR